MIRIGLGGGCHWCTEAVFAALTGVGRVDQGFIRAPAPDDTWSEAILLEFDPGRLPPDVLIDIHLRTHASTSDHKMRGKYRSAIYVFSPAQAQDMQETLVRLQPGFDKPLVTRVLYFSDFSASDEHFRHYFQKNAGGPFCTRYIDPKLDLLRRQFSAHVLGGIGDGSAPAAEADNLQATETRDSIGPCRNRAFHEGAETVAERRGVGCMLSDAGTGVIKNGSEQA